MIYLDNAATTMVSDRVMDAMTPYFNCSYGNPGSIHEAGLAAKQAIELAREQVARVINADPKQIIFTSGGTEANNLALVNATEQMLRKGKNHMIVSAMEHPSVIQCVAFLQKHMGIEVSVVYPDKSGQIDFFDVRKLIRENTGLVSVMAVNNELGTKNPIGFIGRMCRVHGILFHTDCVQAYGNVPINVVNDSIDYLSVSAHKFHGPKGVGFLFARKPTNLRPMIHGGGQEHGLRSGTENVPLIVGMGEAADSIDHYIRADLHTMKELREEFLRLVSAVGGVAVNGEPYDGSKILNLRFDGVDGQTMVLMLSGRGVCVSAGSACSANENEPSHVLRAIGLTDEQARSSIRVSLSRYTTMEEVVSAAEAVVESVKILRGEL